MEYIFMQLTQKHAEDIAYNWHYESIYSFYDMESDEEDLEEFLDAKLRGNSYFSVLQDNVVVGFFCVNKIDIDTIEIGLGMKPDLTGAGKGLEFLKAGLEFVKETYSPKVIILSVATFNLRAIKVYKKVGFESIELFTQETNGSQYEFLKMKYEY
jgi:[ribosomal protein S18]-alanine N-acetyltransferase